MILTEEIRIQKSGVYEVFKKWKAMVENETGFRIKKLRSDNGGEYEDNEFKKFCYVNGIRLERTVQGTPQQNGVAERMNRTLTERARSMRIQAGLPKQFWAEEAISTAAHLINRGPSVPLEHRIPGCYCFPLYTMQTVRLPMSTCDELDKINKRFLWGNSDRASKPHLVRWEYVCKTKRKDGLGFEYGRGMHRMS